MAAGGSHYRFPYAPGFGSVSAASRLAARGWDRLLREFLGGCRSVWTLTKAALRNTILGVSQGVAAYGGEEALGGAPPARGCARPGIDFDVRKWRPYSGYETLTLKCRWAAAFPTAIYRVMLKVEELRQGLRILQQCLDNMPGRLQSESPADHAAAEERTLATYRNP